MKIAQQRGTSAVLGKGPPKSSSLSPSDAERVGVRGSLEYFSAFRKQFTKSSFKKER
jgi:hypothetical protein